MTYTSESSVRRDLSRLEGMSLIRRTHGGASTVSELGGAVPLSSRMMQSVAEKKKIARLASSLLKDGQTVMLDGSSSAGYLVPYIAKHNDMTVFTNNMLTAINSVNYGISTYCIGGISVNSSAVLSGSMAYEAVKNICPDILFFSSQCVDRDGTIYDPIAEENYIRSLMLANARMSVFLCDSAKFDHKSIYKLTSVDKIDVCVFDKPYTQLKVACNIIT